MVGKTLSFALLLSVPTCFALPSIQNLQRREPYGTVEVAKFPSQASTWNAGNSKSVNPASYQYKCFDGTNLASWPASSSWLSYSQMWQTNLPQIQLINRNQSLKNLIPQISASIQKVARESKMDPRIILAIVMQESTGRLDVPCGVVPGSRHCGLMQAPNGSVSFDPNNAQQSILQMIKDGVFGITAAKSNHQPSGWPGLVNYFNGGSDISWVKNPDGSPIAGGNAYVAARLYNSGCLDSSGNINISPYDPTTMAYANDVANRLLGWDGTHNGCMASTKCTVSPSNATPLRKASACS